MNQAMQICIVLIGLLVPALASAQSPQSPEQIVKRGSAVFARSCTQSYCHGAGGVQGGAPRLAGRGFDSNYITKVVTYGIPNTVMGAWGQILPEPEKNAVIMYVESLNGIAPKTPAPRVAPTGEAAIGRDLFSDVTEELGRCSHCHQVGEKGVPVAPPIAHVPPDVAALRGMATPGVSTATADGAVFPALVVMQLKSETKLYDLTTVPPVLHTFSAASVKLKDGSDWKHSTVLGSYSDAQLSSILTYLRGEIQR